MFFDNQKLSWPMMLFEATGALANSLSKSFTNTNFYRIYNEIQFKPCKLIIINYCLEIHLLVDFKISTRPWHDMHGDSLHLHHHPHKPRKRRLVQVMQIQSCVCWYYLCKILNSSSRVYFNWYNRINFKVNLLT